MVNEILGLALFGCVIWVVFVIQRRSEANQKEAFRVEQQRQQEKWGALAQTADLRQGKDASERPSRGDLAVALGQPAPFSSMKDTGE
jgi:hypothetical protein